jgi:hypothetical protein
MCTLVYYGRRGCAHVGMGAGMDVSVNVGMNVTVGVDVGLCIYVCSNKFNECVM